MNAFYKIRPLLLVIFLFPGSHLLSKTDTRIDSILNVYLHQTEDSSRINSLTYLSALYSEKENFDSAHFFIDKAIKIAYNINHHTFSGFTKGQNDRRSSS